MNFEWTQRNNEIEKILVNLKALDVEVNSKLESAVQKLEINEILNGTLLNGDKWHIVRRKNGYDFGKTAIIENETSKEKNLSLKNIFLEGPESYSSNEEEGTGESSFSCSSDARRYYLGNNYFGQSFLVVEYYNELPEELTIEEKVKFLKEQNNKGEDVYRLEVGTVPQESDDNQDDCQGDYRIAQPRNFGYNFYKDVCGKKEQNDTEQTPLKPKKINIGAIEDLIKDKCVLFYTGAGISVAGGIPDLNTLRGEKMKIDFSKKVDEFLSKSILKPEDNIKVWQEFMNVSRTNPATPAHESLASLAKTLNCKIFTENSDELQEKTGIKPIHLTAPWLKENIQKEWLKDVDIVMTVGLRCDDRGFLGWYKENNPKGQIIAINLNHPSYLGEEDFFVEGDAQEIIPELERKLSSKNINY